MWRAKFSFSKTGSTVLAAFIVPVIIMLVIMAFSGVWPLGTNCILHTDMYHQYAPFFAELREKLRHGGSLFFTWNLGLGINFIAIMAYYLANPLNWLVVLAPEGMVIEFMTILIVIRTGLCGASMAYYLMSHSKENGFGAFMCGLLYALSGYTCAYYWNLMWFDSIALFPIIVLGLEKLIRGEGGLLYGASLGFAIFSNYYISIPICMFLVIYFFAYSVIEAPEDWREFVVRGMRFAVWSLIAGGLSMVLLLPEIYTLATTASADNTFPKVFSEYFSIIRMLARHMCGVTTEQGLDHWPNIYCGGAVYLLFVLYIGNKKISIREKAVYVAMCLFFLAGFSINVLNYIWHGFHYPNSLPARQSFIYVFLVLVMCFRAFMERHAIRRSNITAGLGISIAFILLAQEVIDDKDFHFLVFYGALLLTAVYAGIMHLYLAKKLTPKQAAVTAFFILAAELSVNTAYTSLSTTSRTAYTKGNEGMKELLAGIGDTDFYRVERKNRKTKDDGAWLNFHAVSIFSSMANADCTELFKRLGCEASTNAYSITGSTPLVDMLMGVRYAVYNSEQDDAENMGQTLIGKAEDAFLYRNDFALPLGFMSPAGMTDSWMLELDDPTLVQNSLCDQLKTGQVLVPVPQPGSSADGSYAVTLPEDGEYYAFSNSSKIEEITINWPSKKKTFDNLDRKYLMELGYCHEGDLIRFTSEDTDKSLPISVYRFDYEALREAYDVLAQYPLEISEYQDGYIHGTINVDTAALGYRSNRGMIYLSIPYDEGWKVQVDGEDVMIYKGLNAFLSFYLSSGKHEITMRYVPRGFKAGAVMSAISLALMILIAFLEREKKPKHVSEQTETAAEEGEET